MPKVKEGAGIDTALNEFVYTALFQADFDKKRELEGKYVNISMSQRASRRFAEKSTRQEKEYVLGQLGYEFYYVINKAGKTLAHVKQFLPILASKKLSSKAIPEEGIFISSDRTTLRTLGLMANMIHHPTFQLDMEVIRQGYHIQKWSKKYGSANGIALREADEYARLICRTLSNAIVNAECAKGFVGISRNALCILLYLYGLMAPEIQEPDLKKYFSGRFTRVKYADAIRDLIHENMITKINDTISISGFGITKVNAFYASVIHSNNI